LVIISPAEENMRSGTVEVAGTARTFLPKRAIHGTTEEARLNSFRGFLCDGNSCKRILHNGNFCKRILHEISLWRMRLQARARREDMVAHGQPARVQIVLSPARSHDSLVYNNLHSRRLSVGHHVFAPRSRSPAGSSGGCGLASICVPAPRWPPTCAAHAQLGQ